MAVQPKQVFLNDFLSKISFEVVTIVNYATSEELLGNWKEFFVKLFEYTAIYLLIKLGGCGYGWILFLATIWTYQNGRQYQIRPDNTLPDISEKDLMVRHREWLPSWIQFPDFDRTEWINNILQQIWIHVDPYSTYFVKTFIEPEIQKILGNSST